MTHWHESPETVRRLAAAYALGTLAGPARRRFEALMATHPAAAEAVDAWNRRFVPLATTLPPAPAQPALWARIEQAAFAARPVADPSPAAATPTPTPASRRAAAAPPSPPGLWQRVASFFDALMSPVPAAALAAGLAFGLVLPMVGPLLRDDSQATELPESYVGVLATAEGRTGMIVSSLRQGKVVDLKRVAAVAVPADRTLYLWLIDAQGVATPVGEVPDGPFVRVKLGAPSEQVFAKAVELGLTLEPRGSRPASPAAPYVYRGLCGKLWRVPPAR